MTKVTYSNDGDQCVADTDASGNLLRTYTWGPGIDNLLAVTVYAYLSNSLQPSASSYYPIQDRLGSVHALVDESGSVVESVSYDAWGNILSHFRTLELPNFSGRYLFQGREYSAATGLYNFRSRWYDPVTGRWLSKDPIGFEGGLNLYAFCGDDPVNWRDPWGEQKDGPYLQPNSPYLPNGGLPPGCTPDWPSGRPPYGGRPWIQNPSTGEKWFPHTSPNEWPHYDSDRENHYPERRGIPEPNRKRPPKPNQSPTNPWTKPTPQVKPWWKGLPKIPPPSTWPLIRYPILIPDFIINPPPIYPPDDSYQSA